MMLLAGTDYSRGTPLVGPKRIFDMLPNITPDMLHALRDDPAVCVAVSPYRLANTLCSTIYIHAFHRHINFTPGPDAPIARVLYALHAAKLSAHVKSLLPSHAQVLATCANVTWVLHYWKVTFPRPLHSTM